MQARIIDICQRVLGANAQITPRYSDGNGWHIVVRGASVTDPLTRSQQEMDVILSLQHLLQGAEIRLEILT